MPTNVETLINSDLMDRLFPKAEPITTHLKFAQGQFGLLANEARKFGPDAKLLAITGGKDDKSNYVFFQGSGIPSFQLRTTNMKNVQQFVEFITQAKPEELIKFLAKKTKSDLTTSTFTHIGYRSKGFNQFRLIKPSILPQVASPSEPDSTPTVLKAPRSTEYKTPTQDHYLPEEIKLNPEDQKALEQINNRATKKIIHLKHNGKLSINGKILTDDRYIGTKPDFRYLSDSVDNPGVEVQDTFGLCPPIITFDTAISYAIENKNHERDSLPTEMDARNHAIILVSRNSDKKRLHILHRSAEVDTASRPTNATGYFFDISQSDYQLLMELLRKNQLKGYEAVMQTFFAGCDPASKRMPVNGLNIIDLDQYLAHATQYQSSPDYTKGFIFPYINKERIAGRLNANAITIIENKAGDPQLPQPKKSS